MKTEVELQKPKEGTWIEVKTRAPDCKVYQNSMGVLAMSSAHFFDGKWNLHVSFSHMGKRIDAMWMDALLRQWDIADWEEDNHVPNGQVRNYWHILNSENQICPCKENEEPHIETGGYEWRQE